ncbi:PKD domain-containing protein [candidate division WOR-3 bacterium]|nr:PKD domain-containing protein [candidate division WOR-3 bacterium]
MKYLLKIIYCVLILVTLSNCSQNSPPATPSSPSGQSRAEAHSYLSYTFSTTDPEGDDISYQFDWGDGNLSEWTDFTESGKIVSANYVWRETGTYNVNVRAMDTKDNISDWSTALPVNIITCINFPPNQPSVPSGIDSGFVHTYYTFYSSTTDPEGDKISYQFDWGDGNLSYWTDYLESGDTASVNHAWQDTGTYNVNVRAIDTKNKISDWSEALPVNIFTNTNFPPDRPPAPSGVDSGSINTTYTFYGRTTDPEGDSISYQFDWGDGNLSYWSNFVESGETVSANHIWRDLGTYNINVRAIDTKNKMSQWSEPCSLIISENTPDNGLIAEYLFNGNANDGSGNGNHGSLMGNASADSVLKIGDNTKDYMTVPSTVFSGLGDLTISFFIKLNTIHREGRMQGHAVISCRRGTQYNAFLIFYSCDKKAWEFSVEDSRLNFQMDTTIFDKDWHSLIFVREASEGTIYIDGIAHNTYVGNRILNIEEGGVMIGQEQDLVSDTLHIEADQSLAGEIDNLRIYNRVLSNEEIQALYNEKR